MGFKTAFPIQAQSIPPLLEGRDLIGQAKTGSGKTAAFALPMLQMTDPSSRRVQAVVLAPTRELAVQIARETRRLGEYTGVKVAAIYGGQSINVQREALMHGVQVVVGTPGRVIDHIERGWLDLRSVRLVVLDEADTMLDMGFIDAVEFILGQATARKQMCVFSATMPSRIVDLARKHMRDPARVLVDADEPSVETLDQYFAIAERDEKLGLLAELLQSERPTSAMVFCRTKYGAHRLAIKLGQMGFDVVPIHGNLSQHQRDSSMEAFRKGNADILVATDLAGRGIDVSQVSCVVNFDIPENPLLYFHRVGRTARAGRAGKAFSFVSGEEAADFARILRMTKTPIRPMRPQDVFHAPQSDGRGRRPGSGPRRGRPGRWRRGGGRGPRPWRGARRH